PLFYRHERGVFAFGSELKALMRDPGFDRVIDPSALNQYLAFGYIPGEQCIFRGVRKLPQGCAMTYDLGVDAVNVWPYWTLPPPRSQPSTSCRTWRDSTTSRWLIPPWCPPIWSRVLSAATPRWPWVVMAVTSCSAATCITNGSTARTWCAASFPRRCAMWPAHSDAPCRWGCAAATTWPARRATSIGAWPTPTSISTWRRGGGSSPRRPSPWTTG